MARGSGQGRQAGAVDAALCAGDRLANSVVTAVNKQRLQSPVPYLSIAVAEVEIGTANLKAAATAAFKANICVRHGSNHEASGLVWVQEAIAAGAVVDVPVVGCAGSAPGRAGRFQRAWPG